MLHYHPFAALLILSLIGRYSDAAEPRQREMFSTLFEGGSATTLQNVLTAFGLETPAAIEAAATETPKLLAGKINGQLVHGPTIVSATGGRPGSPFKETHSFASCSRDRSCS